MKVRINPVQNTMTGETCAFVEVFDPRVVPARPAQAEIAADPATGRPLQSAVPAYPGTVSLIARFYGSDGSLLGTNGYPLRNDKTALTAAQYEQWSQWPSVIADDDSFFTDCIVSNLGLAKA